MGSRLKRLIAFVAVFVCVTGTSSRASEQVLEVQMEHDVAMLFAIISSFSDDALAEVWESDVEAWRFQMQSLACDETAENAQSLIRTQKNGFETFLQAILARVEFHSVIDGLDTMTLQRLVHDFAYSHYLVISQTYQQAYVQRLKILFHYYEQIKEPFCEKALENASHIQQVFPNQVLPTLNSNDLASHEMIQPLQVAIKLQYKFGSSAFYEVTNERRKNFDAIIYSDLLDNREAEDKLVTLGFKQALYEELFAAISERANYTINQRRQSLPGFTAVFIHTFNMQDSIYFRATRSALRRVAYEYPEIKEALNAHMAKFVQQRLDALEEE